MNTERVTSIDQESALDYKFKSHKRSKSNTGNVLNNLCNQDDDYVTRLNFFDPNKMTRRTNHVKKHSLIEKLKMTKNTALLNEIVATTNQEENLKKVSKKLQSIDFEVKNEEKRRGLEKQKQNNKKELIKAYNEIEVLKRELNEVALEKDLATRRYNLIEEEASKKVRKSVRMSHEEYDNFIFVRKSMEVSIVVTCRSRIRGLETSLRVLAWRPWIRIIG
jgi:hypothetical protein